MCGTALIAFGSLNAQTVVVMPSNPQGWINYGPSGPGIVAGPTTDFADQYGGAGSLEFSIPANSPHVEEGWRFNFDSPRSLSSVTQLSYDWLRSSTSTYLPTLAPAFTLIMTDTSNLTFRSDVFGVPVAPLDQWVTEDALNFQSYVRYSPSGTGNCASYAIARSLATFNSMCYGGAGQIKSLYVWMGGGDGYSSLGAIDHVTIGFGDAPATTWDFEPDQSTVPEPSTLALLGTGLFGLAPTIRRRRRR